MTETPDVSTMTVHSLVNVTLDSWVTVPHALMSMNVPWDSTTATSMLNVKTKLVLSAVDVEINSITLLVSPVMVNNALISMNALLVLTLAMPTLHAKITSEAMTALVMMDTKVMEEPALMSMNVLPELTLAVPILIAPTLKVVSTAHAKMVSSRRTVPVLMSTNASPTEITVMTMLPAPTMMVASLVNVNLDTLVMV